MKVIVNSWGGVVAKCTVTPTSLPKGMQTKQVDEVWPVGERNMPQLRARRQWWWALPRFKQDGVQL